MADKLLTTAQAAKLLGVSVATTRRWDAEGLLKAQWTQGGHRRFDPDTLPGVIGKTPIQPQPRKTIAYARVSTSKQQGDLERQKQVLEMFCAARGWSHETIADLGSGLNYKKKGLQQALTAIMAGKVERLVITHKDRLLRFGAELVFSICQAKGCEVVVINEAPDATFEEDLARDVLEIITVFSAKLYGSRSHKAQKMVDKVSQALRECEDAPTEPKGEA